MKEERRQESERKQCEDGCKGQRERERETILKIVALLASNMEKEATSQGMWATSGSWK